MSLDFAKTVEVSLEGLRQLQPSQIVAITLSAMALLIPFWCYRLTALLIREMRELQKNALAAFNESNKTNQEIAKTQQELAKTYRELLAKQNDTLNAVHSAHESVLAAMPAVQLDQPNPSPCREPCDSKTNRDKTAATTNRATVRKSRRRTRKPTPPTP